MNETVAIALIVSVIAPALMAYLTNRSRRAEKREDWKRQDEVAARVAVVAEAAAETDRVTTATLKDIHTLVNSDMTAARQAELTTTRLLIAALRRLGGDDAAVMSAVARADELELILADRLVAQRKVEADAAAAGP